MRHARSLGAFLYDFVIGDDPRLALVVVVGLGATAGLAAVGAAVWWVMPVAVVAGLGWSARRAAR